MGKKTYGFRRLFFYRIWDSLEWDKSNDIACLHYYHESKNKLALQTKGSFDLVFSGVKRPAQNGLLHLSQERTGLN